jgi:glycosyltransferase involved in cell wall biosynthesis
VNALIVIHYPVFGGPHNQVLRLKAALAERGWDSLVVLPAEPGNAADRLRLAGVAVDQIPLHRLRARLDPRLHLRYIAGFAPEVGRIRRLIRMRRIDLVVVGGLVNPHAAVAAHLERVPVVWQVLDMSTPAPLWGLLRPLVRRLAHALMFDGQALLDHYVGSAAGFPPSFVFYPPVDTERFRPSGEFRRRSREALGVPGDAPVVGMVANLNPEKGIEYFIRAAALIYRQCPDAWFLVVGAKYATHETYFARLQLEMRESGVPLERFVLAGERPDVEYLYPAMDVKLITSIREGTTTTAMEAMACGLPVVATDVGAVHEVVEQGSTGFLVAPRNPESIAEATLRLLANDGLRQAMGEAARQQAVSRFDVRRCADTFVRAYETALAQSHRWRGGALSAAGPASEERVD